MLTEENKFYGRLLSPHLDDLEGQFKKFGLSNDDFVTILHRRLKGKMSRQVIKDTLTALWVLQHNIKTAIEIKRINQEEIE